MCGFLLCKLVVTPLENKLQEINRWRNRHKGNQANAQISFDFIGLKSQIREGGGKVDS